MQATEPHEKIDWLPEYGCAVLKSGGEHTSGLIALNLISLDLHKFEVSSKLAFGGEYHYVDNASSMNYAVQHIGTCPVGELEELQKRFSSKLAAAQMKRGNERSAAGGKQGHQKTPAFIHAVYREAFGSENQAPRGGWTDVGMHTGGQESRPTAWPVVTSALCQLLTSSSSTKLFEKIIAYFGLYVCEEILRQHEEEEEPTNGFPHVLLEHAFRILRSSSLKAAALSDEEFDMSCFCSWSKSIHTSLMAQASLQAKIYSKMYELPTGDDEIRGTNKNCSFDLPLPHSPSASSVLNESKIREYISKNVGWLSVLEGKSLVDVNNWVQKAMCKTSSDSILSMLVLRTIEGIMWGYSKDMPTMEQSQLEMLVSIIDNYREILHNVIKSNMYKPLSLAQLKSREILVVWVGKFVLQYGLNIIFNLMLG